MTPHTKPPPERTWRERLKALENVRPLLKMVWETSPLLFLISIVCRLLRAALPVTVLYVGKLIIDAVVRSARGGPIESNRIWKLVAAELALAIASDLLGRAVALADSLLSDRFTNRISVDLMRHAATLDLAHFEEPEFYDKLERARRQTMGRIQLMAQVMGAAQDMITLATLTSALVVFSPWLLLMLVCAVLPAFLGETHFASLSYSLLYRWTPQRRELDYLRWLGATQESAKEVKIFGLGAYLAERYRRLADQFYEENRALVLRRAGVGSLLALVGTAGYYGAYVVILYRTLHGTLTVGDLTFLAGSFARSRGLIEGILTNFSSISEQAMYLSDLFAFFRMEPRIHSRPDALPAPRPIRHGLELRHVSFRYPGAERYALHDVSFQLHPGQRVALIGENGAGKTTITKLIARLYDPDEGQILLDGVDLREYNLEDWRREIGVIFQDYMRYNMLLWENIGMGRVERMDDRQRIEKAARLSLASDVAARLEKGLDQMVGRRFVDGVDLSGGEWQKVALGRAYMRDAQLLILDEPTATLDARAEHRLFERFAELTRGKIAVLSRTVFPPSAWPTAFWCCTMAKFLRKAHTMNCSDGRANMRSCSSCRPPGTDKPGTDKMTRTPALFIFILLLALPAHAASAVDPSTVLVVVNDLVPPEAGTAHKGASKYIGDLYAAARRVPPSNVVHLSVPGSCCAPYDPKEWGTWVITFADYKKYIRDPIQKFLEKKDGLLKNKIRYIVTIYGVPTHIAQHPNSTEPLSVDAFLAAMYSPYGDKLASPNPYFNADPKSTPPHLSEAHFPWPMYVVTRLDATTAQIAAGLIDKAITAEKGIDKQSGTAYFDFRHVNTDPRGLYDADLTVTSAYELCVAHGFHCVVNDQVKVGHMIDKAPNTLWAWGWYSWVVNDVYTFAPGAVGAQLTSFTANSIRYVKQGTWVPVWLERGITATWGAAGEPYTQGYAKGDDLLNHLWNGYNFGESAYIACPQLNWMMIFIGDPLYTPVFK